MTVEAHASDGRLEALREVLLAFAERDWGRMRELLPADFEYVTSDAFPEGSQVHRGPESMQRVRAFLDDTWGEAHISLEDLMPTEDAVLATMRGHLREGRSGVGLGGRQFFQVWRFEGDRPISVASFEERADALRSAGIAEQRSN